MGRERKGRERTLGMSAAAAAAAVVVVVSSYSKHMHAKPGLGCVGRCRGAVAAVASFATPAFSGSALLCVAHRHGALLQWYCRRVRVVLFRAAVFTCAARSHSVCLQRILRSDHTRSSRHETGGYCHVCHSPWNRSRGQLFSPG